MENYNFYEEVINGERKIIELDKDIEIYQYLPYLDFLNKNLVDRYNRFILRRRYGYYNNMNMPHYLIKDERMNNDLDILNNTITYYDDLVNLVDLFTINFNNIFPNLKYEDFFIYRTYQRIILDNLSNEINRLNNIIARVSPVIKSNKKINKKGNINYLLFILTLLFFIFIILYNMFN